MKLRLVAIGLISMLGQVVLLRELHVAFSGSELLYVLALGVWLLGTAAGAAVGRRGFVPPAAAVSWLLLAFALLLPGAVVLSRGLRHLLDAVPGAYLPFHHQLLGLALVLLPVCALLGLLFQWAARRHVGSGRTLAGAYAIESAGGVVGGMLGTLLLVWGVANLPSALGAALAAVLAAVVPWPPGRPRRLGPSAGTIGVLLLVATAWSPALDRNLTAWTHPRLVDTRDTPYGRVTVTETAGQVAVFVDDALTHESQGTAAEEYVHLAALQHPAPRAALILGGGVEGLIGELLEHRPDRIDLVELDRTLLEVVEPYRSEEARRALSDPAVHIVEADPRRFLSSSGSYDLILIGMSEPDSGRANRFYTREFFEHCAAHLEEDGILALRLRGDENLWTPQEARRDASIRGALRSVFGDVVVIPGTVRVFLASSGTLTRDPEPLVERLEARAIEARMVIPAWLRYVYTNDRFFETAAVLEETEAAVNSDLEPVCYSITLFLWLSRFFPGIAWLELPDAGSRAFWATPWTGGVLLGLVVVLLLARATGRGRRALLAAFAGFAGMVLESVLLLHYQTRSGVLFQDLGVLLTAFMTGLAIGAGLLDWLARRHGREPGLPRVTGCVVVAATGVTALAAALLLQAGWLDTRWAIGALLAVVGTLVAAVFAFASLHRVPEQRAVVSPLYAADLAGGCLGSLAASLLLVPILGLPGAALLTAALALPALLLV